MRLLFLPVYSNHNLNGCSTYNTAKKFLNIAVQDPEVFVHWYLPSGGKWHYEGSPDPVENHKKIKVHKASMTVDQYLEVGFLPDGLYEKFNQYTGEYVIDAVLTERPASALYMSKLLQHPFMRTNAKGDKYIGKIPPLVTFIRDPFVKKKELHNVSDVEEFAQTLGYATSYNIFFSQHDLDMAVAVAKKYLNFAQVKKMIDRSTIIPTGTDTEELDKIKAQTEKRKKFTVIIAERLQSNNKQSDILDAVDYLFRRGMDIDIIVSSQTDISGFIKSNYKQTLEHVEIYPRNPREKYLPLASSCHASLTATVNHSYPQGIMEQLYLGLIVILPDAKWVDAVLPNYPYKVKRADMNQMVAMMKYISENYEEAKQKIAWIPEYIKKNYDIRVTNKKMLDWMKQKVEEEKSKHKVLSGYVDLVKDLNVSRITEKELLEYCKKNSKYGMKFNDPNRRLAFSHCKVSLYEAMNKVGYRDTCDSPYAVFVKD